ncbi:MAG: regulatory protein RecX [Microbacterium sp.]
MPARSAGVSRSPRRDEHAAQWHTSWLDDARNGITAVSEDEAETAAHAEQALLKKLRTRSLSEREARVALRGHALAGDAVETLLAHMRDLGYLDDVRLAEQLVHAGITRKQQGRHALAQSLAQRGIPRDVVEAALAELPDDDADRALEYARTKARGMAGLDRDGALRRLAGQLARRGYGSAALAAARQALDEAAPAPHGVRFE